MKYSLWAHAFLLSGWLIAACSYERPTLWEMKCASCHDGQTVLNNTTMPGMEDLKARYPDMGAFVNSCNEEAPSCMNILKHDKGLFRDVGREIGIPDNR